MYIDFLTYNKNINKNTICRVITNNQKYQYDRAEEMDHLLLLFFIFIQRASSNTIFEILVQFKQYDNDYNILIRKKTTN